MTQSLQALLGRAIDYAGPFPPARLPIPEATREYLALRESADRWIMDRYVCGVASLDEMAGVLAELQVIVELPDPVGHVHRPPVPAGRRVNRMQRGKSMSATPNGLAAS